MTGIFYLVICCDGIEEPNCVCRTVVFVVSVIRIFTRLVESDVGRFVERFARRAKRSHSEIFSAALREYLARHASDEVTDAINRAVDEIDQKDEFVAAAARRVLEKTE